MVLHLGVIPVLSGRVATDPRAVGELVACVEDLGCESIWAAEHVVIPGSYGALSGGRLIAGVGVAWLKEEYDAVGVPFEDRGRRADE